MYSVAQRYIHVVAVTQYFYSDKYLKEIRRKLVVLCRGFITGQAIFETGVFKQLF